MKKRQSNLLLIAILVILLFLLYSVFNGDSELAVVQAKLEKANISLDSVSTELATAAENIKLLKTKVQRGINEIDRLKIERDSLGELYLIKLKKSESELKELRKKEIILGIRINELRRKNELFE